MRSAVYFCWTSALSMLWRGTASDAVSDNPKENEGKINEGVARMFKDYPPKKA
jgi:hypothetical protein